MIWVLLATIGLLASGAVIWSFLRFANSFGQFTEAVARQTSTQERVLTTLLALHESNQMLLKRNERMAEQLAKREVA